MGHNAIVTVTDMGMLRRMREYCIANSIPVLMVYMRDKSENRGNVGKLLLEKGRPEQEVEQRNNTAYFHTKDVTERFCDFTIENSLDVENHRWSKTREDLLKEFYAGYKAYVKRQQLEVECCRMLAENETEFVGIRKSHLKKRWLSSGGDTVQAMLWNKKSGHLSDVVFHQQANRNPQTAAWELDRELGLQNWLDTLLMADVIGPIYSAAFDARDNAQDNPLEIRASLEAQYLERKAEIEDPNNHKVAGLYQGLVNMVPLMPNESIAQRMDALRYPSGERTTELPPLLRKQLVEISVPYHNRV